MAESRIPWERQKGMRWEAEEGDTRLVVFSEWDPVHRGWPWTAEVYYHGQKTWTGTAYSSDSSAKAQAVRHSMLCKSRRG